MISVDRCGRALARLAVLLIVLWLAPSRLPAQEAAGGGDPAANPSPYAKYVGATVQKINIEIQACPWCTVETTNLVRDLISLETGKPFSLERYALSLEELNLSKRFEEIVTAVEQVEGGIAMSFYLTPAWVLRDIRVSGHAPLFKTDVLKAMSISPGDALQHDVFTAQAGLIEDLYRREGFVDPQVSLSAEKDAGNGSAILDVSVTPGRYFTLHRLTVSGNTAVSTAEIKSRMRSWRSSFFLRADGRYRSAEIEQDIKDLVSLYRQRGYAECRINLNVHPDPQQATVAAEIAIVEGPRYEVSFSGHKRFWSSTLKKDLVLFKDGNLNRQGIRRSIANIKNRYRLAGYQFTTVDVLEEKITLQGRVTRKLSFAINEGPCTKTIVLTFTGQKAFTEQALRRGMQTGRAALFSRAVYVPEILEADLVNLRALYLTEGYTDVKIEHALEWSADKTSVTITVAIVEGARTMVSGIRFEGLTAIEDHEAREALKLKKGSPFQEELLKQDEIALSHIIAAQGYPYVDIKAQTFYNAERNGVRIVFAISEGKRVTMGRIYYQGNFATRKRPLAREIVVKPGEAFSPQAMLKGQKNLRSMGIFDTVQFRTLGLKSQSDKVTLL
ncbi:MAG TPA: POTRA domain-containing protein, partial [Deltaproteobacteria bacterium]|nr:POTRA domain-containing protein [Deltaproteobacteria bacterium]